MLEDSTNSSTNQVSSNIGITSPDSRNLSESISRIGAHMKEFQESRKIGISTRPQHDGSSTPPHSDAYASSRETSQGSAGQSYAKLTHPPARVSQPKILVSSMAENREEQNSTANNGSTRDPASESSGPQSGSGADDGRVINP